MIISKSLFSNKEFLTKEIQSWKGFADSLHLERDREIFEKILNDHYRYTAAAINAKGEPFPSEPLIMALLLLQQKMIDWLRSQTPKERIY